MKSKGLTKEQVTSYYKRCDDELKYDSHIIIDMTSKKLMKDTWCTVKDAAIKNNIVYIKLEVEQ